MVLTEIPRYEFYPDISDNLKLPESERLSVEIIRPTGAQRSDFTTVVATREFYPTDQPFDSDGNIREPKKLKKVTVSTKFDADCILRTCVGKIRNLTIETTAKDGKTASRSIASGTELAECRAYGVEKIISAICVEVQNDSLSDSKKKISA